LSWPESLTWTTLVVNIEAGADATLRQTDRLTLFPDGAAVNHLGRLTIGGCDAADLAASFGTPLYIFDEAAIRARIRQFRTEFEGRYPQVSVLYACKAFTNRALLRLVMEEGIGLDVVSGGEIEIARSVGFPMERVSFPGNNKSAEELSLALDSGVGRIVVDNFDELKMLGKIARSRGQRPSILLRLTPGVDPHTHRYEATGTVDSKFGFPMAHGERAVAAVLSMPELDLRGLHFHVGSQLADVRSHEEAVGIVLEFAARLTKTSRFTLGELSVGGGYPVQYTLDSPVPDVAVFARAIADAVKARCSDFGLPLPRLVVEPGRSLVAQAGVALYTVGTMKEIPGIRTYVSVDGGMADNIRPALYQSRMEAVLANRMNDASAGVYTIAGKFCESGDILIHDIELPGPESGDLLAVPGCGAYNIPQACNYNAFLKPAVVMVVNGRAREIRRRETIDDITRCDVAG
jgi:diaminopimelate decarboxylase